MKVRVIGAGPCGSVAAVSALRAGHEVEVFEEHLSAGYPQHCSGLVSTEGLDSLSDLADYNRFAINRISGAVFDFAGEKFEIKRKTETACVIDRAEFDAALARKAEDEGARMFYGKRFSHGTQICETRNREPEAIIGADGALSATAHHFNFPKIGKFAFTLKAMAKIRTGEPHKVFLFYDNGNFPGFFGWLIPHNEYEAEAGMGTTDQKSMKKGFDFLLKKAGAEPVEKPLGRVIPLEPRKKIAGAFANVNVLLAGDAGGQVKSSSGGGVVFGTAGARLAGCFAHAPEEYENQWKRENENDVLAHVFLRNFFAYQPNSGLKLTAVASRCLGLDYLFSLHGNMDRPTGLFRGAFAKVFNIPKAVNPAGEPVAAGRDS